MTTTGTRRRSAAERREEILDAAATEFATRGLHGASTDAIARQAGISQPYLFRLFGTKKELFLATVRRCFEETLEQFQAASEGLTGDEALRAIGRTYVGMITDDPRRLRGQMQSYVACDDPDVRDVVRAGYERLVVHAETLGLSQEEVTAFFARGMLINVMASMGLPDKGTAWADRLLAPCQSLK